MTWFMNILWSSIGKKMMMAVTGLGFCGFLISHLAGNLTLYGGKDAFNAYAEKLHSLGVIINMAEIGLLVFAVIHVITGMILFYQNFRARPIRYKKNKSAGGRSIGSRTMPYTGLILLGFVILHLLDFHFVDKSGTTIYDIVATTFSNPFYVGIYVVAMIVAALHVSHGLWSAFQTIGANHLKYMPIIRGIGVVFSLMVGAGFGMIPIYILMIS